MAIVLAVFVVLLAKMAKADVRLTRFCSSVVNLQQGTVLICSDSAMLPKVRLRC